MSSQRPARTIHRVRIGPAVAAAFLSLVLITSATMRARAASAPQNGHFQFNGKPVDDFVCAPSSAGRHPAVILLHGAAPKGAGQAEFERMCMDLADHGFYAMFLEYCSQTPAVTAGDWAAMARYFPEWLGEIRAEIDTLRANPQVEPNRIALIGFSLGSFLALSTGATDSQNVAAIVEYYGGLPDSLDSAVYDMPPTLILHGDSDTIVPVSDARYLRELMIRFHRPSEIHIYPDAGHAFNFPGLPWYNAGDAADAWSRTLRFLDEWM